MQLSPDIAVVGGGITGMSAALALASGGRNVVLVQRAGGPPPDLRTAALFPAGVALLDQLGAWEACRAEAAPLKAIRIIDDTGFLLRAPETLFRAEHAGEGVLAWNVPNARIGSALATAVAAAPTITVVTSAKAPSFAELADRVRIDLSEGGSISARLAVAADGRGSPLRAFAGIAVHEEKLDQAAIVTAFDHGRAHDDVSTEFHRPAGPLTLVPMPGRRSSLVWVERPREVERLLALTDEGFRAELQSRLMGVLGRIGPPGPRMSFPLTTLDVDAFSARRIALVGEAAHVLPPIGAQGLNLGLADVAGLAGAVADASDPGASEVLAAYSRARRTDAGLRANGVSALNTSLAAELFPLQLARGAGLHLVGAIPPLRRALMAAGLRGSARA